MQQVTQGRTGEASKKISPKQKIAARPKSGGATSKRPIQQQFAVRSQPEIMAVEKSDRKFIAAVQRDVSITPAEAERLAEVAAIVTDCSGTGQLCHVVHPNFAGDYAVSNSDHQYFNPAWQNAIKSQVAGVGGDQGMIVVGANRGEDRVFYTSPSNPQLNTAEIDQVLSVPPGAVINVTGAGVRTINVPANATTTFVTGFLRSNNAPQIAVLPSPNTSAPTWAYNVKASAAMSGLIATGDLMNVRARVSGNTCTIVYRTWVRNNNVWTPSLWNIVEGDNQPLTSTSVVPWYNAATGAPDTTDGIAFELCSTDGSDAYMILEFFPGYPGGTDGTQPFIIDTQPVETTLLAAPVSWWNTVASVMGDQLMLGAQEIITCTASQFNNQGTVVAGKLSKGANLSYAEPASDFFNTLSQMPRNNMTGALKFGASGFHIPDFTDRGVGSYDITRDDVRYYVFRTTPAVGGPPPTMELKVYSNVSYGVTSQIIPTFPVEPMPHVYALFAILSAINVMSTNEGHLQSLFDQAKRLKNWILSPGGRKTIGEGVGVAKDVAKFAGPLLASLF